MSGGEYAPKDSRDVTLRHSEPGKSTDWHDRGPDGDAPEDKMAPDDMRNVTGSMPAGSEPGADSGWRDVEGQGKPGADDGAEINPEGGAASAGTIGKGAPPPEGVPQPAEPYSAEEAAEARSHQE
jgi:hypothetical protein